MHWMWCWKFIAKWDFVYLQLCGVNSKLSPHPLFWVKGENLWKWILPDSDCLKCSQECALRATHGMKVFSAYIHSFVHSAHMCGPPDLSQALFPDLRLLLLPLGLSFQTHEGRLHRRQYSELKGQKLCESGINVLKPKSFKKYLPLTITIPCQEQK